MRINTIEEMKNALYYRGDPVVSYKVPDEYKYSDPSDYIWPSDKLEEHGNAHLGRGASSADKNTDHSVAIVGWGPCNVEHCKTGENVEAECWIIQNSWGTQGINNGFDLMHTDPDCDAGVLSSGEAIIPFVEGIRRSKARKDGKAGKDGKARKSNQEVWRSKLAMNLDVFHKTKFI